MRRANETLVGAAVLGAIVLLVIGSVWLSQRRFGRDDRVLEARFRTIGGLNAGSPVLMRGVRIGRVEGVALGAQNWVNVAIRLRGDVRLPARPVAIISSTTLFGDWGVDIQNADQPDDPEVRRQLAEAEAVGRDRLPGATLPDIGQLTAQAGRIAGDIATLSARVQDAFDTSSARRLRLAFADLSALSRRLSRIAAGQETTLAVIGDNLEIGTASLERTAAALERTVRRADSASSGDQLRRIFSNTDSVAQDLRTIANNLRSFSAAAATQQEAMVRILANLDSSVQRMQEGRGTLGMLSRDSSLYVEALGVVREMRRFLAQCRENPRSCFSFSVF